MKKLNYFMICLLSLYLSGCVNSEAVPELKNYTKIDWDYKLKMRKVLVKVEDGKIILTADNYENLSKNIEDIYEKQKHLEETILFYESQMKK